MAKMTKAQCSTAGKSLAKTGSSSAGKALAQCRWGSKPKKKAGAKKPRGAPRAGARQSRRIAGKGPVRGPEPPKKPRKPAKKKVGGQSSAGLKKIENILVPGLNAPKGSNKAWLAEQRRRSIWA